MRIGLISDTHIPNAGKTLPSQVLQALAGVDLILHAGDLSVSSVLEWLGEIAPVVAVKGNEDIFVMDVKLENQRVIHVDGIKIGLVHQLLYPDMPLAYTFPEAVDVVVFGDTHEVVVERENGLLLINPGSPTFPNNRRELGTVGILEVGDGRPRAEIIQLS